MHVRVVSANGEAKYWLEPVLPLPVAIITCPAIYGPSDHSLRNTSMSSSPNGSDTLPVEVTHVSANGVWLLAHDKEMFMSYEDFPWFADQPIKAILRVEEPSPGHYYWPDLDVDLSSEIIEHPDRFPLQANHQG